MIEGGIEMSIYKPGRPSKYNPSTHTGSEPPAKPGEYRIRDKEGKLTYIGETNNLKCLVGGMKRGHLSGRLRMAVPHL